MIPSNNTKKSLTRKQIKREQHTNKIINAMITDFGAESLKKTNIITTSFLGIRIITVFCRHFDLGIQPCTLILYAIGLGREFSIVECCNALNGHVSNHFTLKRAITRMCERGYLVRTGVGRYKASDNVYSVYLDIVNRLINEV